MNCQTSMSDEKLIQFYLQGDAKAMATLIELYKDRIYRTVFNMVQDRHVAEEIFQEVFVCMINNMIAGKSAEEGNFLQWATRIAHDLCMEHIRKAKQPAAIDPPGQNFIDFNVSVTLTNNNYHECHGKIKSLIDLLPDDQREVMLLNHYGNLSFNEIAKVMKCSLNTALDCMKFALTNLRKMMHEKEVVLN
jgi:RNA polymerase sigma factor (sigma-70 family)